jgi:hypothetical protein
VLRIGTAQELHRRDTGRAYRNASIAIAVCRLPAVWRRRAIRHNPTSITLAVFSGRQLHTKHYRFEHGAPSEYSRCPNRIESLPVPVAPNVEGKDCLVFHLCTVFEKPIVETHLAFAQRGPYEGVS